MGNVLSKEQREQVIALGGLGWSLRRIEQATGVRRETAGDYPRSAGIAQRAYPFIEQMPAYEESVKTTPQLVEVIGPGEVDIHGEFDLGAFRG
jgi:hypothetical protein